MRLIIGLGNPGKTYQKTRHNVGFMVLDALCQELSDESSCQWHLSKKFNAEIFETKLNNNKVILAKPMTFMNASGQAVQLLMNFYNLKPQDLVVVNDDKDIELGEIKAQNDKSAAGHRGVQSIIDHLHTQDFTRVRVGIAPKDKRKIADTANFVLKRFGLTEKKTIKKSIGQAVEIIMKT